MAKTIFYSLAALVRKILFCHSKIKFISSRHCVISSIYIPSVVGARDIYERAVEFFGEENADEKLFLAFGKFEENCKEVRAVIHVQCKQYFKQIQETCFQTEGV